MFSFRHMSGKFGSYIHTSSDYLKAFSPNESRLKEKRKREEKKREKKEETRKNSEPVLKNYPGS